MAKHDVLKIINQALKHDARKTFDVEVFEQLDTCKLRVAPTGGTSTTSITLTENASTATTNNVALGSGHIKSIVDEMRERNIPGYVDDDYLAITHPTTLRAFKNELETLNQYTNAGISKIANGEIGR